MLKYLLSIIAGLLLMTACRNEFNIPDPSAINTKDTAAVVKFLGSFANGPYGTASGWARIKLKDGKYNLVLEETDFSDGPDLHVYVSKELSPATFIDLGKLKSLTGDQSYDIIGAPDFRLYKYVLIHSQQFNQVYGTSLLQQY